MVDLATTVYITLYDQVASTFSCYLNNQNFYLNNVYFSNLWLGGEVFDYVIELSSVLNAELSEKKHTNPFETFLTNSIQKNDVLPLIEHKYIVNHVSTHVPKTYTWEAWDIFIHSINKLDVNSATTVFTFKLASCILILILIRGGVPRYRYDYLTKIGWIRFLAWTLTIFLVVLLSVLVF